MTATKPQGIDTLLESVSASRLSCFHTCRLQFYFRYVEGIPSSKTPSRHVGSSVHHALRLWNLARWRRQPLENEALKSGFDTYWKEEQDIRWKDDETECHTQAWSLVETYLAQTPIPPNESVEGVEVRVEADLSNIGLTRLVGILDLVRKGGRIVDFKTTAQTPNADKAEHLHEMQLTVYGLLYRASTDRRESGFELHHLVKLKTPKLVVTSNPPITDGQKNRLYRQIESYLEGVRRQDWVPSPSPMSCVTCEYFQHCRKWSGTSKAASFVLRN